MRTAFTLARILKTGFVVAGLGYVSMIGLTSSAHAFDWGYSESYGYRAQPVYDRYDDGYGHRHHRHGYGYGYNQPRYYSHDYLQQQKQIIKAQRRAQKEYIKRHGYYGVPAYQATPYGGHVDHNRYRREGRAGLYTNDWHNY